MKLYLAISAGCLVAGFAGGWAAHQPAPEVHETVRVEYRDRVIEHEVQGPVRVETREVTTEVPVEVPVPGPERVITKLVPHREVVTIETRGPVVFDRAVTAEGTEARKLDLTPPPAPRWGVTAGLSSGLPWAPRPEGAVSYRVFGPVWLELGITAAPSAALRARVQF